MLEIDIDRMIVSPLQYNRMVGWGKINMSLSDWL
jgi:hypothetical protein